MRNAMFWVGMAIIALSSAGCVGQTRRNVERRRSALQQTVHFAEPVEAVGRKEYETQNLRIWVTLGDPPRQGKWVPGRMLAKVIIENKRDLWAHLDAKRACLVDPQYGAANLFLVDRLLPPRSQVHIGEIWPSFVTVNFGIVLGGVLSGHGTSSGDYQGGTQRIMLRAEWEDAVNESVDCTYVVMDIVANEGDT